VTGEAKKGGGLQASRKHAGSIPAHPGNFGKFKENGRQKDGEQGMEGQVWNGRFSLRQGAQRENCNYEAPQRKAAPAHGKGAALRGMMYAEPGG